MPPPKALNQIADMLTAAWKQSRPNDFESSSNTDMMFTSSNHFQVVMGPEGRQTLRSVLDKCRPYLDQYPLPSLEERLRTAIADAREACMDAAKSRAMFHQKLTDFFRSFEAPGLWETVLAVTGIDKSQPPFPLGPCQFQIMDREQMFLWGKREASGRYDPPLDSRAIYSDPVFAMIEGHWVAVVRVKAVDHYHAKAKAQFRLEEALNALRYGAFGFGRPPHFPRRGCGRETYWDSNAICMQVDAVGQFSRLLDGSGRTHLTICQLSPAWAQVVALVGKESAERTDLERTVLTALEWVGQAAMAPLGSVQLVSLVTAIEVLVLGESESRGKRSKLSRRAGKIVAAMRPDFRNPHTRADDLYRIRSECLHEGATQVDEADVRAAYEFVAAVIEAYLAKQPYCSCHDLAGVLALTEPPAEHDYQI